MPVRTSSRTTVTLLVVMFGLVGAGILAGHLHRQQPAKTPTPTTSRLAIHGTVTAQNGAPDCASAPNTVRAGAPVTILDATGAVVGTASLGPGGPLAGGGCHWDYAASVPVADSYQIQVAGIPPVAVARTALNAGRFSEQDPTPSTNGSPLDSGL